MKKHLVFILFFAVVGYLAPVLANTTYQTLTFSQDWSTVGLITIDDDWSGVSGIMGYRGDNGTVTTGVDPQTVLQDLSGVIDVNANRSDPDLFFTGGVTEFDGITDPVVALNGSGTADAPNIVIFINTTGYQDIKISYKLRDIDTTTDSSIQQIALQYRIGESGDYTNVPAGYVADASDGPSLTKDTQMTDVALPGAANNQSQVQIRIITTNALGNDEWIGIDNISITGVSKIEDWILY